jgi:hypothetical protein
MARPKAPGKVYYLGRLRYRPGIDPPELGQFLDRLEQAENKAELLRRALMGGLESQAGGGLLAGSEDNETTDIIDGLVGDF